MPNRLDRRYLDIGTVKYMFMHKLTHFLPGLKWAGLIWDRPRLILPKFSYYSIYVFLQIIKIKTYILHSTHGMCQTPSSPPPLPAWSVSPAAVSGIAGKLKELKSKH